jgi:hypothetical protein
MVDWDKQRAEQQVIMLRTGIRTSWQLFTTSLTSFSGAG